MNNIYTKLYRTHVERLCANHHIKLEWGPAKAWKQTTKIRTPEIHSSVTYALALHEIGYILGENQDGRKIDREVGAWTWAKNNALTWEGVMEKTMQNRLKACLKWYRARDRTWAVTDDRPVRQLQQAG